MITTPREGTSLRGERLLTTSAAALTIEIGLQLVIGVLLSLHYTATVEGAHGSTASMHQGGFDQVIQGAHYWGSAVLIIHSLLHLVAMTWLGLYRPPNGLRYVSAILTFLSALGYQLSGNLLPYDRHGVQTAAIEASIGARAPLLGGTVSKLMLGGTEVSQATLDRWYLAHRFLLPGLTVLAFAMALAVHRKLRDIPPVDRRWVLIPSLAAILLGLLVRSPLGSAATPADYDAFAAKSSWYMWPLHGTMRLFDTLSTGLGWIGALLLPGLFVAFLFLLPIAKDKIPVRVARWAIGAFAVLLMGSTAIYGGAPAALTGTRDPIAEAAGDPKPSAPPAIDKALAEKGRTLFNKLACANCHGKDGAEALGGPALTRSWTRHPDADYYIRYIVKPTDLKPDSTMPSFEKLTPDELKPLAEFIREPKK